jgi:hypothetical protein
MTWPPCLKKRDSATCEADPPPLTRHLSNDRNLCSAKLLSTENVQAEALNFVAKLALGEGSTNVLTAPTASSKALESAAGSNGPGSLHGPCSEGR